MQFHLIFPCFIRIPSKHFSSSFKIKPKFNFTEILKNLASIEENCKYRGRKIDFEKFRNLHSKLLNLQQQIALKLRQKQLISINDKEQHKTVRQDIRGIQMEYDSVLQELEQISMTLPNMTSQTSPSGKNCKILSQFQQMDFSHRNNATDINHTTIGKQLGLFNFEQAAKTIGSKWVYLLHNGAILENALVQFALHKLLPLGFELVFPPDVADSRLVESCGYNPRDSGTEDTIYCISNSSLVLSATSEILLAGLHAQSTLDMNKLPIRYAAVSHCFRPEVGHYGKEVRGLFRLHQFTKVEMFAFTKAEESNLVLEEFINLQKQFVHELGLNWREVEMGGYELGNSAFRKVDIEVELPMRGAWGEVTSASNCTDYQTFRLCIHAKDDKGKKFPVHSVNATAIAVPRIMQAIIECFYNEERGKLLIPEALHPFTFGLKEI